MDFLKYLDKYELQVNNELVQAQHAVDRRAIERSTIQDIRTRFLNCELKAGSTPSAWQELKAELGRRKDDELRKGILDTNNEWELYRATLSQVLDLIEELEKQEAAK